jgi:hypothetical protein
LGWCIYKNYKWIVFNNSKNELRKYLMPKLIVAELDSYNKRYVVRVEFDGNVNHHIFAFDNDIESNKFALKLKTVQELSESRGQFYI